MNFVSNLIVCLAILLSSQFAMAFSDGGDEEDTTVSADLCSKADVTASVCHAWGLEWELIIVNEGFRDGGNTRRNTIKSFDGFYDALACTALDTGVGNPSCETDTTWRLPNIRELIKMFRYTPEVNENGVYVEEVGNTALAYPTNRKWFNDQYYVNTSNVAVKVSTGYDINDGIEPYILSSTYRDLDGVDGAGGTQVMAMNLMTGAIVTLTTSGDFCAVARKDGTCATNVVTRDKNTKPLFMIRVKTLGS